MRVILIAGMPASGKSTAAKELSRRFGYPILEKDEVKEALFDTLGFSSYGEKRALDVAATAVLLRMANRLMEANCDFILVNNFRADAGDEVRALLEKHHARCVTLFFRGDGDVLYQRYAERDRACRRHAGHALQEHYPPRAGDPVTYTMTREEFREKFEALGMDKFDAGTPRIEVDATLPQNINMDALAEEILKKTDLPL